MTRPAYFRTNSSHGRGQLKNSKPAALKLSKTTTGHKTSPNSGKSTSKRDSRTDFEEDDMAGLPNFCAMCEKQIITPGASILYCSEACRRKDGSRPLSSTLSTGFPSPPSSLPSATSSSHPAQTYPDIVPQRSPTTAPGRPSSIASSSSISTTSLYDRLPRPALAPRADSEAARYLSQFLSDGSTGRAASPVRRARTPLAARAGGGGVVTGTGAFSRTPSHTTLPSLSHTPTSPASSYNSTVMGGGGVSRTLPARPHPSVVPWSSGRHSSTRSIDLVMPVTAPASVVKGGECVGGGSLRSCASTATAFRTVEGELTYEKKSVGGGGGAKEGMEEREGSLRQLFAHEAMRGSSVLRRGDE